MYSAERRLQVHNATSSACGGHTGLVAGCAFAVHILRSYLADLDLTLVYATVRKHVDDITVTIKATCASEAARRLARALPILSDIMANKRMVSNIGKEHIYSDSTDVLNWWRKCNPNYKGTVTNQAKDLGISQRAIHQTSSQRQVRIEMMNSIAPRINNLASGHISNKRVICSGMHAAVLYGCEVDSLNLKQIDVLRQKTTQALSSKEGPKNKVAAI